jgi:hypothetical protein
MMGSAILEIAIGLLFVYVVLSLICSAMTELIATRILSLRSNNLESGIKHLLHDAKGEGLAKDLYNHVLIKSLIGTRPGSLQSFLAWFVDKIIGPEPNRFELGLIWLLGRWIGEKPTYIPSRTFTLALLDLVAKTSESADLITLKNLRDSVRNMAAPAETSAPDSYASVRTQLLLMIDAAEGRLQATQTNLQEVRKSIETWFDNGMEQATAWYKQKTQIITLMVAILLAIAVNADTIMIINSLSADTALRQVVVQAAERLVAHPPTELETTPEATGEEEQSSTAAAEATVVPSAEDSASESTPTPMPISVDELRKELEGLQIIGWSTDPADRRTYNGDWFPKTVGLLITAFAISLGAPFWFDLLNKIVNLRIAGEKPKRTWETTEEERQEHQVSIKVEGGTVQPPQGS